ncbi:MAG: M20/M25/M40 family metallo-hydrolase [Acidobacteriia bacterium]|nr:M20/M25/M40 family metallo-hydrolase [Terriglobia bacterium]
MRGKAANSAILLFLLLASSLCILLEIPPHPAGETAPAAEFSAERAMTYEYQIARRPHPSGSAEHNRVRDALVAELTRLGLDPQIQRTTAVTEKYLAAGSVENIAARLPGLSGSGGAILLAAHYDSVAAGPGAGDDAAGVAALLETLRALRASPPLLHDVIFLFTDAEEDGLLGASAFMAEHPWAPDVRIAINFEARGNSGVSQLFETSSQNGLLISALAKSPHPAGSSFTYEIYRRMPNDTDLTIFKKSGAPAMNFAFIGHWAAYHTPLDNPDELDRGSLQQHGEAALSLARFFGNADLAKLQEPDAVYFSLPGIAFLHYPASWTWPLSLVALALTAISFARFFYLRSPAAQISYKRVLQGLGVNLLALLALPLVAFGFIKLIAWLHGKKLPAGDLTQNVWYLLSLIALCAALWTALLLWRRKIWGPLPLNLGGALILLAVTLALAKWLPGGNYAFLWPLFVLQAMLDFSAPEPPQEEAPALAPQEETPSEENSSAASHTSAAATLASVAYAVVLCLISLPALLLILPLFHGFYVALGLTTMGAPLLALLLALLFMSLAPAIEALLATEGVLLPLNALAAALLFFAAGALFTRYSPDHPQPSMLVYALDADSGKALWASTSFRADSWTQQFVGDSPIRAKLPAFFPPWHQAELLQHDAPVLPLPPPEARLLESTVAADTRTLLLRITAPRPARVLSLSVSDSQIVDSWVNGKKLGDPKAARFNPGGNWMLTYSNPPAEGIELKLILRGPATLKLSVVSRSSGLPEIPGKTFSSRPPDSIPHHSGDETLLRRTFVF